MLGSKKDLIKADYVPSKTEEKVAMVSHKNIIVSDNCYCKYLVCKLKRYALYMPTRRWELIFEPCEIINRQ